MMNKYTDQCPICGCSELKKKIITEIFKYKGNKLEYPNYVIYECSECGEAIVDQKSMKQSGRAIRDFYRKVDGLLTSAEIFRIRKNRLCLTQDEASQLLGGGAKSFARYENSEIIQSKALDNLLRILDRNPNLLSVITGKKNTQLAGIVIPMRATFNNQPEYTMDLKYAER